MNFVTLRKFITHFLLRCERSFCYSVTGLEGYKDRFYGHKDNSVGATTGHGLKVSLSQNFVKSLYS